MKQWHPIFAQLLRPAVEDYYDVQTTVPVGDAPREADIVLLRRTSKALPPLHGLWRHLTIWSILEFKGPTVSPRRGDIDLLVELGLGIDRRLRQQRADEGQRSLAPKEVSFWYLANHLGQRFLRDAEQKLGPLDTLGPGLWCRRILERLVFLVSSIDLPVEPDSLPLHVVGKEPLATERQVAQFVIESSELQQLYGGWLATLHAAAWEEAETMARTAGKKPLFDIRPAIKHLGLDFIMEQVGPTRFLELMDQREIVKWLGMDRLLENLSPAERKELKRRLEK